MIEFSSKEKPKEETKRRNQTTNMLSNVYEWLKRRRKGTWVCQHLSLLMDTRILTKLITVNVS